MPIGTIIAWPLATNPTGADKDKWLECNGQAVNSTQFPKLAALMTHTPDFQGIFLRGFGSQYSNNHYGTVLHKSAALGELQGDAMRNLIGSMGGSNANSAGLWDYGNGVFRQFAQGRRSVMATNDYFSYVSHGMEFDASFVVPTSTENRPVNKAVRYLIKAA